jgi:signal transduction histidine kinase
MGLIVVIGTTLLFTLIGLQEKKILLGQVEDQARMLFRQVVLTRRWIADHGGIFVEKTAGLQANPFLSHNMIVDRDGIRYIRENPALATRHLSEYARKTGYYWFHITSLKPINPANTPDSFEKKALADFATGHKIEAMSVEESPAGSLFRYIAPLLTTTSCRECHPSYKVGDVRGALSVTLPIDSLIDQMSRNRNWLIASAFILGFILFLALYILLNAFVLRPMSQLRQAMDNYPVLRAADSIKSRDEFGKLAQSFDQMEDKIQDYQNTLRDKVNQAGADLRESIQRYQNLSRKKSDFIACLSHELRTPLTAVQGAAGYIQSLIEQSRHHNGDSAQGAELETCVELQRFAGIIFSNTERLERMVNETLDIEKIESGRTDFQIAPFSVSEAVAKVTEELEPLTQSRALRLHTEITPDLPMIEGDMERIKDVLTNLLINAFDYSPEGGIIKVTCSCETDTMRIGVWDQGPGVPPELREKVFEKFYSGTTTRREERTGGTGLGLALCRSVVEAHRGKIFVESAGESGSVFFVDLPLHPTETENY